MMLVILPVLTGAATACIVILSVFITRREAVRIARAEEKQAATIARIHALQLQAQFGDIIDDEGNKWRRTLHPTL